MLGIGPYSSFFLFSRLISAVDQGMRIQVIEIVSEALCCIIFGQSCMLCIKLRRKM